MMMKKNYPLLILTSLVMSLEILPSVVEAKQSVTDKQVAAMVEALRLAAPQTKNPQDGLYSPWKVKSETIKGWTKFCLKKQLTGTEFEQNPKVARQVISCIVKRELNQQFMATNNEINAVNNVACWWMTGRYTGCNYGFFTGNYVQKVVNFYKKAVSK